MLADTFGILPLHPPVIGMKKLIFCCIMMLVAHDALAQCHTQATYREDGTTVESAEMKPVATTRDMQLAFSVSTNGDGYFVTVGMRHRTFAQDVTGSLNLFTTDGQALELEYINSQRAQIGGSPLLLAVYQLEEQDFSKLLRSPLRTVNFRTSWEMHSLSVDMNSGVLQEQLGCFLSN